MKRIAIVLVLLLLAAPLLLWPLAGMSPAQLPAAIGVGTGLGAKLACSARYLSRFDEERVSSDLASYSSLTRILDFSDDGPDGIRARLLGAGDTLARYRPGLGCTLERGDMAALDAVRVPSVAVPADLPWPRGSAAGVQQPPLQALLQDIVATDNAAGLDTRALLVVREGQLLAEAYGPGIDRHTPLLGWSMGKSVTAIMVGRLEAMGLLNSSERGLFAAWEGDERAQVTVQNLLQMSSGLAFEEDYVPGRDATRMLFTAASAADVAIVQPLAHAPGSYFSYSSGTTNMLSRIVFDRVGGSTQAQVNFFHSEIARPLALETTVLEPDASGVFVGSSYVYASARDWARFGQLMLNGGVASERRLLSADWVRRARAPNHSDNDRRYGYQFWLNAPGEPRWPSLPVDAYAMLGNREQVVMMLPAQDTVIVRLGWSAANYPTDANFARIIAGL